MGLLEPEDTPFFTQPVRQIAVMFSVLALVGFGAYLAYSRVLPVFLANPVFNGFIFLVFLIGVIACFWQVFQLIKSVNWIEGFVSGNEGHSLPVAPRLLAPLAALLRSRGARMQIGSSSAGSILDSVATRIDEARDITRYIVNLLIFLGLLGTFWGLATTVPALVDTIRSLAPRDGEASAETFSRLTEGLEQQLGGMGVAFASSLLGLAGSLIVGLLELFAGHGQNRFYRELEEWLSTITRLGFSSGDGENDGADHGASAALLEHFAEQMGALQKLFSESDISRALMDEQLGSLVQSVNGLVERLEPDDRQTDALVRLVDGQERLIAVMQDRPEDENTGVDAESRMRLRSIDVQLLRILEEMSAGRQESLADLRGDFAALRKTIKAAAEAANPSGRG